MSEPINATVARLIRQANLAAGSGDYAAAQKTAQEAVTYAKSVFHRATQAAAHYTLATMLWSDEDASADDARDNADKAFALAIPYSTEYFMAMTLLARIEAGLGHLERAQELNEQLLTLYRKKQNQTGVADVLRNFGDLALRSQDLASARTYFEESLQLYQEAVDDPVSQAGLLISLGALAFQEQKWEEARTHWQTAHTLGEQLGVQQIVAYAQRSLSALKEVMPDD